MNQFTDINFGEIIEATVHEGDGIKVASVAKKKVANQPF